MLKETKIFIDDTPGVSPEVLRSSAAGSSASTTWADRDRLPAADERAGQQREPRDRDFGISRGLKGLAKELTCR
jgi:replicative DNA helicase